MTAFLHDDFTSAGAMDGTKWKSMTGFSGGTMGHFTQAGGFLTENTNDTDGAAQYNGVPPAADYYVEAKVLNPANLNSAVRIMFRWDDGAYEGYWVEAFYADATHLFVGVNGAWSGGGDVLNGGSYQTYAVADATNVDMRVEIVGDVITLKFDGSVAWTGTDAHVPLANNVGLDVPRTGSIFASIDWFEAGVLSPTLFWTNFNESSETA